jgi:guanyl-specific ribonuclease Sa
MKAKFQTNPEQFNIFVSVSDFEAKTREIMSEVFECANEQTKDWHEASTQQALAKAFIAAYSQAQTAANWLKLAEALHGFPLDPDRGQRILTKLTRGGYLRSRRQDGVTFYEVNY